MSGDLIPEGGGGHGEGPVAPGFAFYFFGNLQEAGVAGPEGAAAKAY